MTKKEAQTTDPELLEKIQVKLNIGKNFLERQFTGRGFIAALTELIKNARDWGATSILINTLSPGQIEIGENGIGMNPENQSAFGSVAMSTGKGPHQSAFFGTGSKKMLFSFSRAVTVLTVTEDDSDHIYCFRIETDKYQDLLLNQRQMTVEKFKRDKSLWPYGWKTGTRIIYDLRDPKSKAILRGEGLAQELSGRLPLSFRDILRVDGKPIPSREVIGEPFESVENRYPQLGGVVFELFHPSKINVDDELRFTPSEVGEVPVGNFHKALGPMSSKLPEIYLLKEVCGTISAGFLKAYANEDRLTLKPTLADDPRIILFLKLLNDVAPEIQRRLKISIRSKTADEKNSLADEVAGIFNRCYPSEKIDVAGPIGPGSPAGPGIDDPLADPAVNKLQLHCSNEYELGEYIEIRAVFPLNLAKKYKLSDINWFTDNSRAESVKETAFGFLLRASEIGYGEVRASLPGIPHSAVARYEVVSQRAFRLSSTFIEVELGRNSYLFALNSDKLKGELVWHHNGAGEFKAQGGRALFNASSTGEAEIIASDSKNPEVKSVCRVFVRGHEKLLCVKGVLFRYSTWQTGGNSGPVMMKSMPDGVHNLVIVTDSPAFKSAEQEGREIPLVITAICLEFPLFAKFELDPNFPGEMDFDPRDVPRLMRELQEEGYQILSEVTKKP